jgi:malonate decarboxylase beta subunit
MSRSFAESTARARVTHLLDAGSFKEILGPAERVVSPHLALLGVPSAFDDGVIVGSGLLAGQHILIAAQEGEFMGGGVGEVHGAKLVGLFQRALMHKPAAVIVLAESGGVRLHEANAGLIAVSEVMRALLAVRVAGIPVLMLIGGSNGCFGGMGLIARCADWLVMSDMGRLAMSGPEVIESSNGVEEFDSRDRALVWRTTGGKHRYLMGDCDVLVEDDVAAFRDAALAALTHNKPLSLATMQAEHAVLTDRLNSFGDCPDALDIWLRGGVAHPDKVADLEAEAMQDLKQSFHTPTRSKFDPLSPQPPAITADAGQHAETPAAAALNALLAELFGADHQVTVAGDLIHGTAQVQGAPVTVVGSTNHAAIGVELALAQAGAVLACVRQTPGQVIVLLVDTQGQRLRHRDELLGINRYMAHMGCCIELARQQGHRVIGLVYDQALSGGFITSGLIADACYALPKAEIRVMRLPAMARVTKIDEARLAELSKTNPVFAPGVENFVAMGGIQALWSGDLQACLADALRVAPSTDERAALGRARGGRNLAELVTQRVVQA